MKKHILTSAIKPQAPRNSPLFLWLLLGTWKLGLGTWNLKHILTSAICHLTFYMVSFSQSPTDAQVAILSHQLKSLRQENVQVKKEYLKAHSAMNAKLDSLYQSADNKIMTQKMLLAGTIEGTIAQLADRQQETDNRFLRYRTIIQTAIILGLFALCVLTGIIILLFFKFKKNFNLLRKNLYINEKTLSELSETQKENFASLKSALGMINRELTVTNSELVNLKMNEFENLKMENAKLNTTVSELRTQNSEHETALLNLTAKTVEQITELKKETAAQFNSQVATLKSAIESQIAAVEKTIT